MIVSLAILVTHATSIYSMPVSSNLSTTITNTINDAGVASTNSPINSTEVDHHQVKNPHYDLTKLEYVSFAVALRKSDPMITIDCGDELFITATTKQGLFSSCLLEKTCEMLVLPEVSNPTVLKFMIDTATTAGCRLYPSKTCVPDGKEGGYLDASGDVISLAKYARYSRGDTWEGHVRSFRCFATNSSSEPEMKNFEAISELQEWDQDMSGSSHSR